MISSYFEENFLAEEIDPGQKTSLIKDILVDADALVALAKINDSNHEKAVKLSNKLQKAGVAHYFSPFTIAEAATVLSHKTSHDSAKKFLKEIRSLDVLIIELPEEDKYLPDEWFYKQDKKGTSYFDSYNLAILDKYRKEFDAIFSFDEVYKRNGFKLLEDLKI